MNDIVWLTMRRMRTPLILLIFVFFTSVFLMVLVPGINEEGEVIRLGFLDATYFVAIMATTIGFGEIPYAYTGGQRLLVLLLVFPNVVVWLYSIGSIITLLIDQNFQGVLRSNRFEKRVKRIRKPFYIVCGFGNTGEMVAMGLLKRGLRPVILEKNSDRVTVKSLKDRFATVPVLCADATQREYLELGGINHPACRGTITTTDDDHANLTIAITSKLLQPQKQVFARSEKQRFSDNMLSFRTDYVVDPYQIFAERLLLALTAPQKYLVQDWLISVPGTPLRELLAPPSGRWVICGAGRFGKRVISALERAGQAYTVIDVNPRRIERYDGAVRGRGTEENTLREAGIEDAVGLIAGTGDDVDNLSIIMTAREINPNLFTVAREEQQENLELFDKLGADLVAQRSLIVARRILAYATTPLLKAFLDHLVHETDDFSGEIQRRLTDCLQGKAPSVWVNTLDPETLPGIRVASEEGVPLKLRHVTHKARSGEDEPLDCVCLVLARGAQRFFLPDGQTTIKNGDQLLFAGRSQARWEMELTLHDPVLLLDVATPERISRTSLGRWFSRRAQR